MKNSLILFVGLILTFNLNAQTIDDQFFAKVDRFFKENVTEGRVDYVGVGEGNDLKPLIFEISQADVSKSDDQTKQAFLINAYNLYVIKKIVDSYPIQSVAENSGFFSKDKVVVAKVMMTLNQLENERLIGKYNDPRYHFVLVCGALGCPPITNFAYTPEMLDDQMDQQTRLALNDPNFIQNEDGKTKVSEIFKWYKSDFGSNSEEVIKYINSYRTTPCDAKSKYKFYDYDWTLNSSSSSNGVTGPVGSNQSRYIVSSTIPKGSIELKLFNNLYSQQNAENMERTSRSSFFTTSLSAFYGLSSKFNLGINTRFRKVRNNALPSSPFSVFGSDDVGSSRSGLTAFGPQIRWAPVDKWSNFSIQSSYVFAIGSELTGSATQPFIDWNGPTWNTQFFNDFSIGTKFSLFTEVDFLWEDMGSDEDGHFNQMSIPITLIFSYVPTTKLTIYTLGNYSPFLSQGGDYFRQFGAGSKYQFTPNFEIEVLYTDFLNQGLSNSGGTAETINLGIRVNI